MKDKIIRALAIALVILFCSCYSAVGSKGIEIETGMPTEAHEQLKDWFGQH
jgi:hypothetical protein